MKCSKFIEPYLDNGLEQWRDIKGYEGLYQVSSYGNVKSLNYKHTKQEKVLKPLKDKDGYLLVVLYKEGKQNTLKIHRLVAQAFIPNCINLPIINHKDENKANNCVSNLEWCSVKYNNNYGNRLNKISLSQKGKKLTEEHKLKLSLSRKGIYNTKKSKSVLQFDLEGNFIREFPSIRQVERDLGFNHSNISAVCLGKLKTANNYKWRYKESI